MPKIPQSREELIELLQEQILFLKASSSAFDEGFEGECKRLAVTTRVMVYDFGRSKSLLTQLDLKSAQFVDTASPYNDRNLLSHSSLVQFHLTPSGAIPKPHLDSGEHYRLVSFDDWWNGIVIVDQNRIEYNRKDIVLVLANKEGGAHVDPDLDNQYVNLRKNNALGWLDTVQDGRTIPGVDHVPATMRQIAHELLKSVDPKYSKEQIPSPDTLMVVSEAIAVLGTEMPDPLDINLRTDRPLVDGIKVGRDEACPCHSGKKYGDCCLREMSRNPTQS